MTPPSHVTHIRGMGGDQATRAARRRLVDHGSDLSRPLEMDFFVAIPDEMSGETVAARASQLGFATRVVRDSSGEWTCYCTKVIVPSYETVAGIEGQLEALAHDVGGYCEGFESCGNATAAAR